MTAPGGCNCHDTDDLWAQRLDDSGRKTWSRTDVGICTWGGMWGGGESLAALEPDAGGGAIVAWIHGDGPSGTFAQRLAPDGGLRWGTDGVTVFVGTMGYKWADRSAADPGGGIWFGLDAAAETGVRIGRCVPGDRGLECAPTIDVPLSGTLQTLSLRPGDAPGRALIVAAASIAGGRSRIDVIPLEAGPDGRIRSRSTVNIETLAVGRAVLAVTADGTGGAVLGWTAPSGTGFEFVVRSVGWSGRTRWTRRAGPAARAAPFAVAPDGSGATVAWQPAAGFPLAVERLDGRGRPVWRRFAGRSPRAERMPVVTGSPAGPLLAWIEWEGGERESLRAALLGPAGAAGATIPVDAEPVLRSDGRITIERIAFPAPGRAVLVFHDAGSKALRAFGMRLR